MPSQYVKTMPKGTPGTRPHACSTAMDQMAPATLNVPNATITPATTAHPIRSRRQPGKAGRSSTPPTYQPSVGVNRVDLRPTSCRLCRGADAGCHLDRIGHTAQLRPQARGVGRTASTGRRVPSAARCRLALFPAYEKLDQHASPRRPGEMMDNDITEVWRMPRTIRAIAAFLVLVLLFGSIGNALGELGPDTTPPVDVRAAGAAFFALNAIVLWRIVLHPLVGTTVAGIVVRNPVRSYFIEWIEIVELVPWTYGLFIRLHTGRRVLAVALPRRRWLWSPVGKGRADQVARDLENRIRVEQSDAISRRRRRRAGRLS